MSEPHASRVVVVGGCGHVGLPLSVELARHHEVHIYDVNEDAARMVRSGRPPFLDEGLDADLRAALDTGLQVHTTPEVIARCDYVVLVIGTPVDEHLNPAFGLFDRVLGELSEHLRSGQTLVLRSTVYPGTTRRVAEWLQRRGLEVEVAFCPERVAEGVALREIKTLPQIVSALSPRGLAAARALFAPIGAELVELQPAEAELAKLFTNAWRYIAFAVANQFLMVATDNGLDFDRILRAIKHNYPRAASLPGPGFAAGPCLFKDTMQLSALHNNQFFLGHAAMLVNEGMPRYVVDRIRALHPDLREKTVGVLGMAFKPESDDPRESLSYKLKKILQLVARRVLTTDPFVADPELLPLDQVVAESDILIVGTPHRAYAGLKAGRKPVIDLWTARGFVAC